MSGNNQNYFDLHVRGIGYLNRARIVTPKKGKPFFAVTIAAFRGDEGEKTYFDCKIVGNEAKALFEAHQLDQLKLGRNGEDKAIIGFNLGDLYAEEFTYSSEHTDPAKAGKKGFGLKARLLKINYLKINEVVVVDSSTGGVQQSANQQQAA